MVIQFRSSRQAFQSSTAPEQTRDRPHAGFGDERGEFEWRRRITGESSTYRSRGSTMPNITNGNVGRHVTAMVGEWSICLVYCLLGVSGNGGDGAVSRLDEEKDEIKNPSSSVLDYFPSYFRLGSKGMVCMYYSGGARILLNGLNEFICYIVRPTCIYADSLYVYVIYSLHFIYLTFIVACDCNSLWRWAV